MYIALMPYVKKSQLLLSIKLVDKDGITIYTLYASIHCDVYCNRTKEFLEF